MSSPGGQVLLWHAGLPVIPEDAVWLSMHEAMQLEVECAWHDGQPRDFSVRLVAQEDGGHGVQVEEA